MGNALLFDQMLYTDHLLKQVGLRSHLDKGWFAKLFACTYAADLGGCKDEYLAKFFGGQSV